MLVPRTGLIGLNDVYEIDPSGKCISLGDRSSALSLAIPKCPQCQRPVQQYTTHRYNRLINRAVIDEMSKRFIVTGQTALQEIERRLIEIDTALKASRQEVVRGNRASALIDARQRGIEGVTQNLGTRLGSARVNWNSRVIFRTTSGDSDSHPVRVLPFAESLWLGS